ncbi:two component transcriptional regulator, LuxR family [Chthoniobacter flavus Ellin428]|uniref:Two component transcriptional regulator, LuxR family n=1 Tax=Chthoniobacter flavus Ellin428 TaxID=497964 RepID=B4D9V4_9BACT|nr:response regulator transcription factor [Chthoniobacter flavus]EDY16768.1 two component transcriptional regulator, LuxR family [Chthoniobacter flavus Ellin428]TCO86711.1 LuxR family two component transcriptional regulator [Chthoniobacter flavus]
MPIRISIVEDDRITRESLAALIARAENLECLDTYANAEEALHHAPERLPDVLLVDINLPGRSGIECVAALKTAHPRLNVLMLTTYDDTENIFASLRAGASGYLLKRTPSAEIITAIREVHAGGSPMSMHIARKVVSHFHLARPANPEMQTLTPREHEILTLLARGLHYKEIADQLGISTSTVRAHLHTIYGKLHVQSRTEAVVKFLGK